MKRFLSLAHLTAIDLSPPALIRAAAETGFDAVGLRLIRASDTTPGYPLMNDRAAMRETLSALGETGLQVHDIELVKLGPSTDLEGLESFLDAGAELGASEIITAPNDPELFRLSERLADFSERAAKRRLGVSFEFFPWTNVPDLGTALEIVNRAGPDVGILVDSLHFNRSGGSLEALRSLPKTRVRFAHLCDAPVLKKYTTEDLLLAGRAERLPPGEGDIDLKAFVAALPPNLPLALEVPMTKFGMSAGSQAVIRLVFAGAQKELAT